MDTLALQPAEMHAIAFVRRLWTSIVRSPTDGVSASDNEAMKAHRCCYGFRPFILSLSSMTTAPSQITQVV